MRTPLFHVERDWPRLAVICPVEAAQVARITKMVNQNGYYINKSTGSLLGMAGSFATTAVNAAGALALDPLFHGSAALIGWFTPKASVALALAVGFGWFYGFVTILLAGRPAPVGVAIGVVFLHALWAAVFALAWRGVRRLFGSGGGVDQTL